MTPNEEKALAAHAAGLNCAQSVVTTYAGALNFDEDLAERISTGFGGGMGRLQETCGAVTGGFMIVSIVNSQRYPDIVERKNKTYAMVQDFNRRFAAIHGTNNCRQLLGCDLNTEEGRDDYKQRNLSESVCNRCIADAVRIVDELIK